MGLENMQIEILRGEKWEPLGDINLLQSGETFRIKPIPKKVDTVLTTHGDGSANYIKLKELGLLSVRFSYELNDMRLGVSIDTETNEVWATSLNDVELKAPVKVC